MPREGHKFSSWSIRSLSTHFNPRAPRGARPTPLKAVSSWSRFQSTCPARGTTLEDLAVKYAETISIHVPREGHDEHPEGSAGSACISIHVPREGHDARRQAKWPQPQKFQSTCPARGTTINLFADGGSIAFQSTCPARGTTGQPPESVQQRDISIHVPREGHDFSSTLPSSIITNFNPRAPRGARQLTHF